MSLVQPKPEHVQFEHHHDGLGVGTAKPRISWSFPSRRGEFQNWYQVAYQIEVALPGLETLNTDQQQLARTVTTVQKGDSIFVPWPVRPLRSREIAKIRVRVHGEAQDAATKQKEPTKQNLEVQHVDETQWSEWSHTATVETGLLDREDWSASLIESTASDSDKFASDGSLRPVKFRSPPLSVKQALPESSGTTLSTQTCRIVNARLYITSHGVYEAQINGARVGNHCMAPGWTSYKHRLQYQTYCVTDLLKNHGQNVNSSDDEITMEIQVAPGWYASRLGFGGGRRCIYGDTLGVLAQLHVDVSCTQVEGSESPVERSLVFSTDALWQSGVSPVTQSEIYDGEIFDARIADDAALPGTTSSWVPVKLGPFPSVRLISPDAPPVRITQEIQPVDIFRSPSGKTIIDFGQNLVGKVRVNLLDKPKDHRVRFWHAEVLEHGELGRRPLRFAEAAATIISGGHEQKGWSPTFTFFGFRYVQVDGWSVDDPHGPLSKASVTALVMHTDMQRTGWFESSHGLLDKLHENATWSMRGNFFSIPTDCPQRDERLGWTGDIQVFSPSASFLYDTSGLLSGWLEDVAVEQKAHDRGIPPFVVPNVLRSNDSGPPDDQTSEDGNWMENLANAVWDDVTVILPWDLYRAYGDIGLLTHQYESMQVWIDRGVVRGNDSLWDPDVWQLGDWLDPAAPPSEPGNGKTDGTLVADAYLIRITKIMAETARVLGRENDAARYTGDRNRLASTFQNKYITPAGLVASDTQTAYALAIINDLFDHNPKQRAFAADRLIRSVRQAGFRVATGFAGTPIILHALTRIGHPQYAYRMLMEKNCPSWMYPVLMGATTIWERWDSMLADGSINPGEMTSFNHYALGSVVNWLHEVVGGISPLTPGWQKIKVQPVPGAGLTRARAEHTSTYGAIVSSWNWNQDTGAFGLELTVPPNCTAHVVLPDQQSQSIPEQREIGVWVGSGIHHFHCQFFPRDPWPLNTKAAPFSSQAAAEAVQ